MHDFEIGRALGRSFGVWFKNLVPFLLLSAIIYSPLFVWLYLVLEGYVSMGEQGLTIMIQLVTMLLGFVLSATLIYGVLMQLRGQHAPLGKCVGVGLGRLFPVLGVSIVTGLVVGLGFILLIVPGIILYCMFFVAVPVAVIERPGVSLSMKRSQELTKGSRVQIFGLMILVTLIGWVASYVLTKALGPTLGIKGTIWLAMAEQAVIGSFSAVLSGVVYHDLREAREGTQVEDLARIFD